MSITKRIFNIFRLNPDYEKRVFGLDIMRSLAIIFVVMAHGSMLENAGTGFPWIALIDGVELFFVLSGFLIGGMLLKIFETSESFGLKTITSFWIRRWFRTLPNYYLILLLNIVVVYFGLINEDFSLFNWKFFLFLQNFSGPQIGFFVESWSLSIEEWFYLLFPLILSLAYFAMQRITKNKKTIFLNAIFIFLLIPFILRVSFASKIEVDEFWLGVKIFKVVIYRLDSIALGLFAAFLKYYYPKFWSKSRIIGFIAGIIISYMVMYTSWAPNAFATKVFSTFLLSTGCFMLLPMFDSIRKGPKVLVKIFTHVSLISYSMYLLNLALISEVISKNFPTDNAYSAWVMYVAYWGAVIIFSTLLFKYYEKPMMDLRDKWNFDFSKKKRIQDVSEKISEQNQEQKLL